ncbi:tRNA pseudouridine(55) synthase TruB [Pseudonocardia spinosispora]|uniref:tRNA pseudouridine(55) synthase TruB n=1 Tax=Pseudonocardia spinosispora TaxID=103441 RepID=UPI00048AC770|nr:tRNA pseudouridine(55) synthase TruB [Pseudonocardia spinosispora]
MSGPIVCGKILAMDVAPGLVIVDKPAGMTSHDVVSRLRKLLGTRKIGHAGTLDPMATGVLVLGVQRATRLLGHLALDTKAYRATIRLGASTSTDDAEGETLETVDASGVAEDAILAGVQELTGDIEQRPSSVSAIKVDGKRAYARVRAGEEVELPTRPVTVSAFTVEDLRRGPDHTDLDVSVECSSGTYIRALARDLGAGLGVGGHLTALRRTRVGPFGLDLARTLEELADRPEVTHSVDAAVAAAFRLRTADDTEATDLSHGRALSEAGMSGVYAVADSDGRALALVRESDGRARPVLVLAPATPA